MPRTKKLTVKTAQTFIVRVSDDEEGTMFSFIVNTSEPMSAPQVKLQQPVVDHILYAVNDFYFGTAYTKLDELNEIGVRVTVLEPDTVLTLKRNKSGRFVAEEVK